MRFQWIVLVLIMALGPLPASAMQPLGEDEMSDVIGRDGVILDINLDMTTDLAWEDTSGTDGVPPGEFAGMLFVPDLTMEGLITIRLDVGSTGGAGIDTGVLSLMVSMPEISIDDFALYVLDSSAPALDRTAVDGLARVDAVGTQVSGGTEDPIMTVDNITMGDTRVVVQFGRDAANFLYVEDGSMDISMDGLSINDVNESGSFTVDNIRITNLDLTGTSAAITGNGLIVNLPAGATAMNVAMARVGFNNTDYIGDVFLDMQGSPDPSQIIFSGK